MPQWGKSDMEGVPPAPYGVTFAPHHVSLACLQDITVDSVD